MPTFRVDHRRFGWFLFWLDYGMGWYFLVSNLKSLRYDDAGSADFFIDAICASVGFNMLRSAYRLYHNVLKEEKADV